MLNSFYYSFLALPLSLIVVSYYVYLPKWYADFFGATVGTIGLYILIVRVLDAFTDPLCGVLSDYLTRKGISRLFLLVPGTLMLAVSFYLLLNPSHIAFEDINIEFFVLSLFFYLGATFVSVPYESIGVSSTTVKSRGQVLGLRDSSIVLGTLLASAIPVLMAWKIPDDFVAIRLISIIYSSFLLLSLFVLFLYRSTITFPGITKDIKVRSVFDSIKLPFLSSEFKILSLSYFISGLGMALPASLFLFFCDIVLGLSSSQANTSLLIYFGLGILFLPVWILLSKKVPMIRLWFIAQIINAGFFLPVAFLSKGDFNTFLVLISLSALGFGGSFALPSLIQAQIVDSANLKIGGDSTGVFMGTWAVVKKFSQAIGSGIGLYVIGHSGLDAGNVDSESLQNIIRVLYAVVPSLMCFGSIFVARRLRVS